MSLIKRSDSSSLINRAWLSDFFDNDRFFDYSLLKTQALPAVNVRETEKNFEIDVAVPGMSRKDFNVSLDNRILTISSEKKEEKETKEKDFTRQEFNYSSFSRSFTLPENAKEEDVQAKYEDGILKLTIAKKVPQPAKTKKSVEIK